MRKSEKMKRKELIAWDQEHGGHLWHEDSLQEPFGEQHGRSSCSVVSQRVIQMGMYSSQERI